MSRLMGIFGGAGSDDREAEASERASQQRELEATVQAISQSQAVIEFDIQGKILTANKNFLDVMGYSLNEVVGQHHSLFVDSEYRRSTEYTQFWQDLARGVNFSAEFKRKAHDGKDIWILGSYNPLLDEQGKVYKVIKFAIDITESKSKNAEYQLQIEAIGKSQAVIEFEMDGTIISANKNFLDAMGYSLDEIKGRHHRMFAEADYAHSEDYRQFWEGLNRGQYESGEYKRIGKNGKEVWIQASYNPIMDLSGKPVRVVKYASDVTKEKLSNADFEGQLSAIGKSQAVIEFSMEGIILAANDNFLSTMGYTLQEIRGKHHSIFAEPQYAGSREYTQFWESLNAGKYEAGEFKRIGKNGREVWIQASYNPILDMNGVPMKVVKYAVDITPQKELEVETKVLANRAGALKICQKGVMMADMDNNIVYLNDEMIRVFRHRESDLNASLGNFRIDDLVGSNIDVFHKNPSHQRGLLANLNTVHKADISVGDLHFGFIATPWTDQDGERIGTIVEWMDKTAEVAIEQEIDSMVVAAGEGDFSKQVSVEGKTGFFLNLGTGLNKLISTIEVSLNDTLRMLGAMSRGDLSERITREYLGTFGQLKDDANLTADKLTDIITRIRNSSSAISSAANEIAQGNADLSQRTEEQASSLEETASSMEEMTSTVKQSADNAQQVDVLAKEAQDKARQGGDVVSNAVLAMSEINDSSKKIADIIGVIDEIAFQTNLLALNAAVEAARAGEQGRGFAVVAGEVRNLAQRSAAAAKEIKDLIRDSVDKVEGGARLVNESGQTLENIVGAVDQVTSMIKDIATAATEQTSGIEQVNTAVSQMDEMTQQNAALVEEASAAAEAMADQARNMTSVVDFFSIGGASHSNSPSASASVQTPVARRPAKTPAAPSVAQDDSDWEDF